MNKVVAALSIFLFAGISAEAADQVRPAFTSQNFSGSYDCKGSNESIGDYDVTATLRLKRLSSYAKFGTYDFLTQTANSVTYTGQAVANGNRIALTYRLNNKQNSNFTTGISEMKKNSQGQWTFHNYYYESDDTGGNYGHEFCVMKASSIVAKPVKKPVAKKKTVPKPVEPTPTSEPSTSDFIPNTPE